MIQSADVQLQVVLRALSDVVAPALASAEKHIVEQLHLSMATIGFVKTRLPDMRRFFRMELRAYRDLASEVANIAGADAPALNADIRALVEQAQAALDDPEKDTADYEIITRSLREAVTALATAVADAPSRRAVHQTILERHGSIADQARVWCLPFGFELEPDKLAAPAW
jgi:hypothetical protein